MTSAERVLFVHAHPDDESNFTGGTIATLIDSGAHVSVLTCTGEPSQALSDALAALGVSDHRFLGTPDARWPGKPPRDYTESGPDALVAAPFGEVSGDVASVISAVEPTIVVSYDEWGGSGHPDHVRTHQAARRAAEVLGVPFFVIDESPIDGSRAVDIAAALDRKRAAIAAFGMHDVGDAEYFRRLRPPGAERETFAEQPLITKISLGVITLALGSIAGLLLTASHQSTVLVGETLVPWGIIVALFAATGLIVGLRIVTRTRLLSILASIGLLGFSALLASPTRGGSIVVVDNLAGQLWTWVPPIVIVLALAWPNLRSRRTGKIEPIPAVKGSSIQ
jgi:N-acetyl-1-D-myo-inositol-2-amino-2-deoxy-alpha-D-glucopyranoside deacetylase